MILRAFILFSFSILCACSSGERKLYLDDGVNAGAPRCGTESFLNKYADYVCSSIELEENNEYATQDTPLHNIKDVVVSNKQRLLVVEEKLVGTSLRERDQEVVCHRRLKVVLNPGVGIKKTYQKGWITYDPKCFRFFKVRKS